MTSVFDSKNIQKVQNFINNEWFSPQANQYFENFNPATGEVLCLLPDSGAPDIHRAVQAAQAAQPAWSSLSADERSQWLHRLADGIQKNIDEFALLESRDQGKPVHLAKNMDMNRVVANFRFFASAILHSENLSTEMGPVANNQSALNYTIRKPLGVAGLIAPWNLPLYLLSWKIAPAIACGNTVVCKPSEFTSMTAVRLAELLIELNFPKGVINIVFGTGAQAGDALVRHEDVPLISFTGGTATGRKVIEASAEHFKKLSLELGGKNPNLIFSDCHFENMLNTTLRSSFLNQGEICLCGSRIYVEEDLYPRFLEAFVAQTKKLQVGDPNDPATFMGPLVSKAHQEKVLSYIELARQEGGRILCGGEPLPGPGYFVQPTVIVDLPESSRCVQEEIFGPVVTVASFKTEDEALKKANGVKYGLSATLWTENLSRAHRFARDLRVGTLWINTWLMRDLRVPFGGMKASGLGREGGAHSLDFYSELTTVCLRY